VEDPTIVQPDFPGSYPGGAEATRVINAPTGNFPGGFGDQTQQALTAVCPVCQSPNIPSERYCQDCGFLLGSATVVDSLPDAGTLPRLVDADGREFALNPGVNTVGREAADVLLADLSVSRRHAQLTLENGVLTVEDLGSSNGTKVGGKRLGAGERAPAYDGDTIRFGTVSLTLSIPGGPPPPAGALPAEASPSLAPAPAAAPAPPVDRGEAVGRIALPDGVERPLYAGVNTVGRRSANDVVIVDSFMSGRHAEIHCDPDGTVRLIDVGSTNGTFVNGERLAPNAPVELTDGQAVTMGKTLVTYYASGGGQAASPAVSEAVDDSAATVVGVVSPFAAGAEPGGGSEPASE
jgi:pSer/pThr/pTyr-binding forkhead associated (FHA) protein